MVHAGDIPSSAVVSRPSYLQRQASGAGARVEELTPSVSPASSPAPRMRVENITQGQGTAREAVMGMQPQQFQQRRASRPSVGHQ